MRFFFPILIKLGPSLTSVSMKGGKTKAALRRKRLKCLEGVTSERFDFHDPRRVLALHKDRGSAVTRETRLVGRSPTGAGAKPAQEQKRPLKRQGFPSIPCLAESTRIRRRAGVGSGGSSLLTAQIKCSGRKPGKVNMPTTFGTYNPGDVIQDSHIEAFNAPINNLETGSAYYAADAGSTDAYAVTMAPVPSAYTAGMMVHFKANTANAGPATLNVNGLGSKAIKKKGTTDLATGDILSGQIVSVIYDGANFQWVEGSSTHVTSDITSVATDRLLGRDTAGTGTAEQLTVGGGVEFTGSGGIRRSALTGDVTAAAGSNATTIASNSVTTAKIADAAVTSTKLHAGVLGLVQTSLAMRW